MWTWERDRVRIVHVAAALLTVTASASAAPIPLKQLSFIGAGELVHEGFFEIQTADVKLEVTLRRAYTDPPLQLWVGAGALTLHTPTRHFDLVVNVAAQMLTGGAATRTADAMEITISGTQSEGALALAGLDGFLRGAGAHEYVVNGGPDHGRYDVLYGGLAQVTTS